MDITIEVMLPPRGTTDWTVSCNPTYRVLAPIAIYLRKTVAEVFMPCTGYLHVNGMPEHPTWPVEWTDVEKIQHMNAVLTKAWDEGVFHDLLEKRQWSGNANALNNPTRTALLTDRQATISFNTLKNLFRDSKRQAGLTEADFAYPIVE